VNAKTFVSPLIALSLSCGGLALAQRDEPFEQPYPAYAQQWAYAAKDINLRAGPSTDYPIIVTLLAGASIAVQGCLEDYSWCDVVAEPYRGWVYAGNIAYPYQGSNVPVISYGAAIGIGILAFSIGSYWDRYYRAAPWYPQRDYWINRPPPPRVPGGYHPRPPRPDYGHDGWQRPPQVQGPTGGQRPPPQGQGPAAGQPPQGQRPGYAPGYAPGQRPGAVQQPAQVPAPVARPQPPQGQSPGAVQRPPQGQRPAGVPVQGPGAGQPPHGQAPATRPQAPQGQAPGAVPQPVHGAVKRPPEGQSPAGGQRPPQGNAPSGGQQGPQHEGR